MKSEYLITPHTKINSKWIKNLKARHSKTLRGKHRTLFDINCSKILFDLPPTVMKTKGNKWDLIKFKSFYTIKETVNKTSLRMIEKYLQRKQLTKDSSPIYTSNS